MHKVIEGQVRWINVFQNFSTERRRGKQQICIAVGYLIISPLLSNVSHCTFINSNTVLLPNENEKTKKVWNKWRHFWVRLWVTFSHIFFRFPNQIWSNKYIILLLISPLPPRPGKYKKTWAYFRQNIHSLPPSAPLYLSYSPFPLIPS